MADLSTPVIEVIDMFVKRKISSVPIVDEEGMSGFCTICAMDTIWSDMVEVYQDGLTNFCVTLLIRCCVERVRDR